MTTPPTPTEPAAAGTSAPLGRRVVGLGIDWALAMAVSSAFFADPGLDTAAMSLPERVFLAGAPFATLSVWAAQHLILVASLGTTIGHRIMGLRVVREDGRGPVVGPLKAAIRTALIAVVIPAVVWGPDGRGLHDKLAGTRIVRR